MPPKPSDRSTSRSAKTARRKAKSAKKGDYSSHDLRVASLILVSESVVSSVPTEEDEASSYDGHSSEDDTITSSAPEVDIDGDGDTVMTTQVTDDGPSHSAVCLHRVCTTDLKADGCMPF